MNQEIIFLKNIIHCYKNEENPDKSMFLFATERLRELEAAEPGMDEVCAVCKEEYVKHRGDLHCPRYVYGIWRGWKPTVFTPKPPKGMIKIGEGPYKPREKQNEQCEREEPPKDKPQICAVCGKLMRYTGYDVCEDCREHGPKPAEPQEPAQGLGLPCGCSVDGQPVKWNPYNQCVQCHKCGAQYLPSAPAQPRMEPYIKDKAAFEEWANGLNGVKQYTPVMVSSWLSFRPVEER